MTASPTLISLIEMGNSKRDAPELKRQTGVIGASGFVGGAVVRALRNAGENPFSLISRLPVQDAAVNATATAVPCEAFETPIFRRLDFQDEHTFVPAM